jgi:hypothetical protein
MNLSSSDAPKRSQKSSGRPLLVSHWPVNSQSAVDLLKGTFKAMQEAENAHEPIGRAEALRRSINAYRSDPNQFLANNAHPPSWWWGKVGRPDSRDARNR